MYRSIVVPLDGSHFAEQALPLALAVARATGAELHLVHVHVALLLESVPYADADHQWDLKARGRELAYLDDVLGRVRSAGGVEAATQLLEGDVASAVMAYAGEVNADLVVMATHGRGGVSRAWLGSAADEVVRQTRLPVLLVRPTEEEPRELEAGAPLQRILIPLDGSPLAEQILRPASVLGDAFGASYTVLRVVTQTFVPGAPYVARAIDQERLLREEREREAQEYLDALVDRLRESGMNVEATLAGGAPARVILEQAEKIGADAIAIATHGRGAALRALLGSVADKVVRGTSIPVLVYRPEHE